MGYWLKYLIFIIISLPLAFFLDRIYIALPSSFHMSFPSDSGLIVLAVAAALGRYADALSTFVALAHEGVRESAPSLGDSPSPNILFSLALIQTIIIYLLVHFLGQYFVIEVFLGVVALVSFYAAISNLCIAVSVMTFRSETPDSYTSRLLSPRPSYMQSYPTTPSEVGCGSGAAMFVGVFVGNIIVVLGVNNPIAAGIIIFLFILACWIVISRK